MFHYLKRLAMAVKAMRIEVKFDPNAQPGAASAQRSIRCHPQAHFEIIGLEAVKREYIAHWPSIHQRVHQIVQMIIRQHLQPGEDFRLAAQDRYVISFARDAEAAGRCANAIRAAVMDLFIFDLKMKDLGVQMSMRFDERGFVPGVHGAPEKPMFIRPSVHAKTVVSRDALFDDHDDGRRPLLMRNDDGRAVMPAGIEVVFSPVTSLADNTQTCLAAFARLDMGTHQLYGYDVLPVDADDEMLLELDIRTISHVCQVMERMEKIHGYPSKVLCPVHYRTIADPLRRASYLLAFAELQRRGYDRFVAMQLNHMPRALYGNDLHQPIEILSRLSSRVVVMVPIDWTSTGELTAAGARAIGLDFQEMADMPPEAARIKMRCFVKQVNREKMASYIFAVQGPLKDIAAGSGFSHLCDCEMLPQFRAGAHERTQSAEFGGTA